jgi:hypothetical protein
MTASGQLRRFRDVHVTSGPAPKAAVWLTL